MTKSEKFVREMFPKVELVSFHDERGADGLQWLGVLKPDDMGSPVVRCLDGEQAMWKKLKNKIHRMMLKKLIG